MFASGWIEPGVDSRAIRHRLKSDACDWTKCYKWNMGTVRISGPRSRRARRARQRIDNEGEWASWGGLIHRRHRRNIHLHNSFLSVRFPQAGILNHRGQRFPILFETSNIELSRFYLPRSRDCPYAREIKRERLYRVPHLPAELKILLGKNARRYRGVWPYSSIRRV